jgi:hypothetical protein
LGQGYVLSVFRGFGPFRICALRSANSHLGESSIAARRSFIMGLLEFLNGSVNVLDRIESNSTLDSAGLAVPELDLLAHALLRTFRSTTSLIVRGVEIIKVFRGGLVAQEFQSLESKLADASANCAAPELVLLNSPPSC